MDFQPDLLDTFFQKSSDLENQIGYVFLNKQLLFQACVHRSFFNEHRDKVMQHNERLEFLGDAVLDLVVSQYRYKELPREGEGYLSKLRSQVVDASTCAQLAHQIGIDQFVLLGKGEKGNEGRGRENIYADLFEAIIGAIYLDGGIDKASEFIYRHCISYIERVIKAPPRNWKAELQEYVQKKCQKPPTYKVIEEIGPEHSKIFHVAVYIEDLEVGRGSGPSKKDAEVKAACTAMRKFDV